MTDSSVPPLNVCFWLEQGVDGGPGAKGDNGDPGKAVSTVQHLHHTGIHTNSINMCNCVCSLSSFNSITYIKCMHTKDIVLPLYFVTYREA